MRIGVADIPQGKWIEPPSVLAYLRAARWTKVDEHHHHGRHVTTLFESRDREVEVHVPVWTEARDYARCLAGAINVIAAAEGRSAAAVLSDLEAARADVLRVRLGDAPLSLSGAIASLGSIRILLELAARTTGFAASTVEAVLQHVTVSLAEPSQHDVRVLVPVSAHEASTATTLPHAAEDRAPPPGRRVTETLARLVSEAHDAAQAAAAGGSPSSATTPAERMAVWRALAAIGAPFELELAWALTRPRKALAPVRFTATELAALAALSPPT
jgi:hypothetical protein